MVATRMRWSRRSGLGSPASFMQKFNDFFLHHCFDFLIIRKVDGTRPLSDFWQESFDGRRVVLRLDPPDTIFLSSKVLSETSSAQGCINPAAAA